MAGPAGIPVAAHMAIEPDMEPVRRIFGDDAGQRFRIRRADQDQAAAFQRLAEARQRRLDVGKMLDDVVADHEVEAVGREAMALDVAEDRLLRIVVVADLVLVDIDDGDMGAAQHVERQEAGRAAAGFVDRQAWSAAAAGRECRERQAGCRALRRAAVRAATADARPARQRRPRCARSAVARRAPGEIDRDCLVHLLLSDIDVGEFGSEKREADFQAPASLGDIEQPAHRDVAGRAGATRTTQAVRSET